MNTIKSFQELKERVSAHSQSYRVVLTVIQSRCSKT